MPRHETRPPIHDIPRAALRAELVDVAHRVSEAGLVISSSGNISVRVSDSELWITGSGSRLGDLTETEIATVLVEQGPGDVGESISGDLSAPRPSMETPFHRAIYRARPDIGAVIHFQSPWATILSCAEAPELDLSFVPEFPAYVQGIGVVPFELPGSAALARAVGSVAATRPGRILLLQNHGQIAFANDLSTALRAAEFFEFVARLAGSGVPLRRCDASQLSELRRYGF